MQILLYESNLFSLSDLSMEELLDQKNKRIVKCVG